MSPALTVEGDYNHEFLSMNVPFAFTILTVSGLCFLGVMTFVILRFKNQVKSGLKTSGRLIGYQSKTTPRGQTLYFPIVEFKTVMGQLINTSSIYGSSDQNIEEGSEVNVIYQPDEPAKFFLESYNPTTVAYFSIIGLLLTYSVLLYFLYKQAPTFFNNILLF